MNVRQLLPRTHEGYAACFAAAAAVIIVAALASMADAGGVRRAACNVGHQQAVVAAVPYPVVGYQVGQYLQQQAVDEHAFRASPSKERLTFLEGYYVAKQEELRPAATEVATAATCPDCEAPAPPQAFSTPIQPVVPPEQENGIAEGFAASFPGWQAACATCHSGEDPKGGLSIATAFHAAFASDDCQAREHFARLVADGEMPKGKTLDDAAKGALLLELYRSK